MNHLILLAALAGSPSTSPVNGCYGGYGCYGYGGPNVSHVNAAIKDGDLQLSVFVLKYVAERATAIRKEKTPDGTVREVPYEYTIMKAVPEVQNQVFKIDKLQGFDQQGNMVGLQTL